MCQQLCQSGCSRLSAQVGGWRQLANNSIDFHVHVDQERLGVNAFASWAKSREGLKLDPRQVDSPRQFDSPRQLDPPRQVESPRQDVVTSRSPSTARGRDRTIGVQTSRFATPARGLTMPRTQSFHSMMPRPRNPTCNPRCQTSRRIWTRKRAWHDPCHLETWASAALC